METKWLEDFISLAETRSFSRSAELRHVTQPAFSRRIQSLEAWLGSDLIDRTSYPTRLTAAGEVFYEQAVEMLGQINNTRAMLRGKRPAQQTTVDFAVPHTLSLTYFPKWLSSLESGFGALNTRLIALNVHDAVMTIVEGGCDLLLCYHHPRQPVQLDSSRYDMLTMGHESVRPQSLLLRLLRGRRRTNRMTPKKTARNTTTAISSIQPSSSCAEACFAFSAAGRCSSSSKLVSADTPAARPP